MKKITLLLISASNLLLFIITIILFIKIPNNFFIGINFKDIIPLIIAIITVSSLSITYLYNQQMERNKLEIDIEREREFKKQKEKEDKYKSLIPYIFLKRSFSNIIYFHDNEEIKHYLKKHNDMKTAKDTENFEKDIYSYAQRKISETIWFLYTFASEEVIESINIFNKAIPTSENSNNKIEFELVINAIRKDMGYNIICFKYGTNAK